MRPLRIDSDRGPTAGPETAADVLDAAQRALGRDDGFVILTATDRDDTYAQARFWDEEFLVEYRDGSPQRHFQARTPSAEQAARALLGWATGQPVPTTGLAFERLTHWD